VKQTIQHYELSQYALDFLQATSICVRTFPFELTVTAVYSPPKYNLKKEQCETFFSTLGPRFMAGGDFNSKHTAWGSRITTIKGRELFSLMQQYNYSFLSTGRPTYWPSNPAKRPDLLDFFVTNGISSTYLDNQPSYDLSSDHSPIIASISSSPVHALPIPRLHNFRTNWCTYRATLQDAIQLNQRLKSEEDVETATRDFLCLIQEAARQATPPQVPKTIVPNIPLEIKELLAKKRNARAKWQRSHAPTDKRTYNRLSNNLKSKLRAMRANSFENYVSTLNRHDNSIWKPIKTTRKPVSPTPPPPPPYV